jgi:hypothetical protein
MRENNRPVEKLRLAETAEEQKQWMAQWRLAEKMLLEVKREELRALTDEKAVASFNALNMPPELVYRSPARTHSLGFFEQQRIFGKARRQQRPGEKLDFNLIFEERRPLLELKEESENEEKLRPTHEREGLL